MNISNEAAALIEGAAAYAQEKQYEYITPELLLFTLCEDQEFQEAFTECRGKLEELKEDLTEYMDEYMEQVKGAVPQFSAGGAYVLAYAEQCVRNSGNDRVEIRHIVRGIWQLEESYAVYFLQLQGVNEVDLLREMAVIEEERFLSELSGKRGFEEWAFEEDQDFDEEDAEEAHAFEEDYDDDYEENPGGGRRFRPGSAGASGRKRHSSEQWKLYAPCINDSLEDVNPLIGREQELERTIQILCRRDKNNPLHIGEPGVGKTALTYGLAKRINEGKVPTHLQGSRIFALDLGGMLAGTQYRGDFEKRFKKVLGEIEKEERPIIYMDEIHNLSGAGAVGESSFDASNMLKPYLAAGHIRFIGATTFEEYKKYFEKNKSLVRRFQNVEIKEPSEAETIEILNGLKSKYETFHGVSYEDGVLEYAVSMSAKYINERYLPDKAIDLMDEAGAYRKLHPIEGDVQTVDQAVVSEVLTKICRVPAETVQSDELSGLASLEERLKSRIFGQDEAIAQVVNAIKFSRAGLLEEGKPLASLLFVGPTGVGKTEIARSLAEELGVKLLRFDMSEYGEKHTVAKLIGSPAGYVGYEEGGLLTEEIRKNPSSVLLLDEIEKAHPDIYNVLLQVMDYATLTDNQGRKADFRNVVVIMTSNAGANRIGKKGIGFQSISENSSVVMEEVKRTFQPEFRNRLNRIVVFRSMDEDMAVRVVQKKLSELKAMLDKKSISFTADEKALQLIRKKGISEEFGAREVDRVIRNEIKPMLVDDILFGKLKTGGSVLLTAKEEAFEISFGA